MALTTERLLWLRARRRSMKRRVLKAASAVCISSTCPCIEAAIRAKTTWLGLVVRVKVSG